MYRADLDLASGPARFLCPLFDKFSFPNATRNEFNFRDREGLSPGQLIDSLPTNAQHLRDLSQADKMVHPVTVLDSVKTSAYLDTVKRQMSGPGGA